MASVKNSAHLAPHPTSSAESANGMPCCAGVIAAQAARRGQQHAARREERGSSVERGSSDSEVDHPGRPPHVKVPADAGWPGADGRVHASPAFGARRRCGDGSSFTPVRAESGKDLGDDEDDGGRGGVCGFVLVLGRCVLGVVNSVTVQTCMYFTYVFVRAAHVPRSSHCQRPSHCPAQAIVSKSTALCRAAGLRLPDAHRLVAATRGVSFR